MRLLRGGGGCHGGTWETEAGRHRVDYHGCRETFLGRGLVGGYSAWPRDLTGPHSGTQTPSLLSCEVTCR